tara:strand:+ start:6691 stop:7386 length:696 start_codon:yes stop_codon:yes gene_type:complete
MTYVWGLVRDGGLCLLLFLQWLIAGVIVDATTASGSINTKRPVSLYLAIVTLAANFASLFSSFLATGRKKEAQRYTETLLGVFFEVITSCQAWGLAFAAARLWALPPTHDFLKEGFLFQLADSVFEMTLVQAGVGFVNATPLTTVTERVVAWFTVTVGGILTVNFFLVSIILGRRAWWLLALPTEQGAELVAPAALTEGARIPGQFGGSGVPLLPGSSNERPVFQRRVSGR